jgi:hypothetical protein
MFDNLKKEFDDARKKLKQMEKNLEKASEKESEILKIEYKERLLSVCDETFNNLVKELKKKYN